MFNAIAEIYSTVWKGMKENQECTSGDYYWHSIVAQFLKNSSLWWEKGGGGKGKRHAHCPTGKDIHETNVRYIRQVLQQSAFKVAFFKCEKFSFHLKRSSLLLVSWCIFNFENNGGPRDKAGEEEWTLWLCMKW